MLGKYIMTKRGPILFPGTFMHDEFRKFEPESAGFFMIHEDKVIAHMESAGLNMRSKPEDKDKIREAFDIEEEVD